VNKALTDTFVNFPTRHWYDRPARNSPGSAGTTVLTPITIFFKQGAAPPLIDLAVANPDYII